MPTDKLVKELTKSFFRAQGDSSFGLLQRALAFFRENFQRKFFVTFADLQRLAKIARIAGQARRCSRHRFFFGGCGCCQSELKQLVRLIRRLILTQSL
jgi:hypothetical protein